MESRKTKVVDGFTVVKMVQRAKERDPDDHVPVKKAPEAAKSPPAESSAPPKHYGKTVQPTRHDIRCYECGYQFHLSGKVQSTYCPKCRVTLELVDYTIAEPWDQDLKTAGSITLAPGGILNGGTLMGTTIVINGEIHGGDIHPFQWLEIGESAKLAESYIKGPNLRIASNADVKLKKKLEFKDVELFGHLKATLKAAGMVHIHPGGCFSGRLQSEHLQVDEGGGLKAEVSIKREEPSLEQDLLDQ